MLEAEWAFPTNNKVHGVCDLTEGLLRSTVRDVLESQDVNVLWRKGEDSRRATLLNAFQDSRTWERMTYTEAIRELGKTSSASFEYQPKWGHGLQSEHEKWLAESLVGGPVFVTDYPAVLKPFYMRVNDDEKTVDCFDLLVPHVGELVGGSVREERMDILEGRMSGIEGAQWYLDTRKYGGTPHVGFGMGFERLVSWVSGIENIRECTAMPRWAGRMLL
jgi:asparaginyl-tRNA synthetase